MLKKKKEREKIEEDAIFGLKFPRHAPNMAEIEGEKGALRTCLVFPFYLFIIFWQ